MQTPWAQKQDFSHTSGSRGWQSKSLRDAQLHVPTSAGISPLCAVRAFLTHWTRFLGWFGGVGSGHVSAAGCFVRCGIKITRISVAKQCVTKLSKNLVLCVLTIPEGRDYKPLTDEDGGAEALADDFALVFR
jgi:hypothetical protein